ncbi:phospholipase D family protein [Candidatus Tisiphia endosymbiont of Ptychoptera albimana]|uniref:phospholipase D family nuclease n=1 Tax=Candidatus Tisiphia endosymbiont of Ptychoptera albimana TaxID=3066260 RepID=UPI00312CA831
MKKLPKKLNLHIIISFLLGITIGIGYNEVRETASWHSFHTGTDNLNVCFTPPSGCGSLIAKEISKAKDSIYVQAFGLTSQNIVEQLIKAKQNGVQIRVLLDRSNLHDRYSKIHELKRAGIDVSIDKVPGIAHNKVMIIDKSKVITGSFNFTNAADNRNAENVLLIENSDIAATYLQSWFSRRAKN